MPLRRYRGYKIGQGIELGEQYSGGTSSRGFSTRNDRMNSIGRDTWTIGQRDSRQLATEFVTALRRADSMLEQRQMRLRSQLEGLGPIEPASVTYTKRAAITDHEEDISHLSSISTSLSSSSTMLPSHFNRPSSINLRHKVSLDSRSGSEMETATVVKAMSTPLPTIVDVDDPSKSQNPPVSKYERQSGGNGWAEVDTGTPTEASYTSSLFIQLRPRPSTNAHPIVLPNYVATSASPTPTANTIIYVISSGCNCRCAHRSHSPQPPPIRRSDEARIVPEQKYTPRPTAPARPIPPPPPFPPFRSGPIDRYKQRMATKNETGNKTNPKTGPALPSSLLTELRAVALKRQMSMKY